MALVRGLEPAGGSLARVLDAQKGGDYQALRQAPEPRRLDDDPSEPRVDRQPRHTLAEARDAPLAIDRRQLREETIAVVEQAPVRRIDERELFGCAEPERRHLQNQAREIGAMNLRLGVLGPLSEVGLGVQPDADTLAFAAATSLALIGAGARDRLDRQPLQLGPRTVAAHARQPRVDHEAHARNGERGLRDVGGQDDSLRRMRREDPLLLRCRQSRVERQQLACGRRLAPQQLERLLYLPLARQEDKRVARDPARIECELRGGTHHGACERRRRIVVGIDRPVADFDGVTAPLDLDDWCAAEVLGKAPRLDRCGRDHDPELGAPGHQPSADSEQEIEIEVALVRFVENERVVASEPGIALELSEQHTVGHQLDQRSRAGAIDEPDLVADQVAER